MTTVLEEDPAAGLLSSEDEQDEEEEVQIESLVQGRAKRSTAGRNMAALIDAAADDDLTLLFEEVEDDNEFAIEEAAEDEDLGLDSSSDDDDDDQGPNAQNEYEGEQQLQKDERKKRRAQNDLRFQTLRKRVKIDPTAVSAIPAPPRPKKKSERISWLPTPEDGPTRSSSRRQTMVNKEMTHARLKDSQEKRVRIIATMKEAEKRKAHLKPKEMTQEDHLAEAERIERTNSKSLNRWEQAERKKAEERRARIEALQNRRLDGPVMSYWSGLATWVNGRLTRVGKVEIKPKPEKEVAKKKKTEKDEKPAEVQGTPSAQLPPIDPSAPSTSNPIPNPADGSAPPADASTAVPIQPTDAPAQSESASTSAAAIPTAALPTTIPPDAAPASDSQSSKGTATQDLPVPGSTTSITQTEQPTQPEENLPEKVNPEQQTTTTSTIHEHKEKETSIAEAKEREEPQQPVGAPPRKSSQGYPLPIVEIVNRRDSIKGEDSENLPPTENGDPMDIDKKPEVESTTKTDKLTTIIPAPTAPGGQSTTSANTTSNLETPQAPSANAVPLPTAPGEIKTIENQQPTPHPEVPSQAPADAETPNIPEGPQIIEHTGRNLTILENFDDRTAHSKKFSMYFNARKPPRLSKISSSLCVITSLPSRYRDPETSLPYANSYAYGQIRRLESQDYTWSGMLGCFVGPAETAAKGVPARFLGGEKNAEEKEEEAKEKAKAEAEAKERAKEEAKAKEAPKEPIVIEQTDPAKNATPAAATETVIPKTEPMEVDG
ncbi:uncharacterized protein N7483_009001 [Penicillium malachiteum]|uniref:uncharacterized protein n=1 Tax=Penicillium malachiteum TaxID=1324776 RepID=UPI002548AD83|nr:uncharacterized protein N7483_009001 [Penicillium malachiteum]KAJ5721067.1 hypothetical protein N7483_009001 [Penicillium malachiteum]